MKLRKNLLFTIAVATFFLLAACSAPQTAAPTAVGGSPEPVISEEPEPMPTVNQDEEYRIVTLLPRDAIPAIDNPRFFSASAADDEYAPNEPVIGVVFNDEARAYSIPFLSGHEIVNDTVGGTKIAVTW